MDKVNFEVGQFAYASWGYGQTNIDWYVVVKRTAKTVWLQPWSTKIVETIGWLEYRSIPGESPKEGEPQIRRRIKENYDDTGHHCKYEDTYGIIRPWDGNPKRESHYN